MKYILICNYTQYYHDDGEVNQAIIYNKVHDSMYHVEIAISDHLEDEATELADCLYSREAEHKDYIDFIIEFMAGIEKKSVGNPQVNIPMEVLHKQYVGSNFIDDYKYYIIPIKE